MFSTGDRVSRDYMVCGTMNERLGNITYADKSVRVAHVVFDNHKDGKPILCTFESLRLITEPESETPEHSNHAVLERFALLKEGGPVKPFTMGQSVAFLKEVDDTLSIGYGRIKEVRTNGSGTYVGLDVYDRAGKKHSLPWGVSVVI